MKVLGRAVSGSAVVCLCALALGACTADEPTGPGATTPTDILTALPAAIPPQTSVPAQEEQRPFADLHVDSGGQRMALADGDYLVALLNADCVHCEETVDALNALASAAGLPPLVGLVWGDDDSVLEQLECQVEVNFPLDTLPTARFFGLIGAAPPRLALVRDGRQLHFWDDAMPAPEQVRAALAGASPSASGE